MIYVRFTEHNGWEGETWHFYIPLVGNEDALCRLEAAMTAQRQSLPTYFYRLDIETTFGVDAVAALSARSSTDYLREHTILAGQLTLPDDIAAALGPDEDALYKGGIRDWMVEL